MKKAKPKKKRHILAWFILIALLFVVGMGAGFTIVLFNTAADGTVSPFFQSLKDISGSFIPTVMNFVNNIWSQSLPRTVAIAQSIIATVGGALGIIVSIKVLRRK